MASVNKAILQGYLGHTPVARTGREGKFAGRRYAILSIATTRWVNNGSNSGEETSWHEAIVLDDQAEYADQHLFKGNGVYVEGYLYTKVYTGRDGVRRWKTYVVAEVLKPNATKIVEKQSDSGK